LAHRDPTSKPRRGWPPAIWKAIDPKAPALADSEYTRQDSNL
jgi:hypothetical protein